MQTANQWTTVDAPDLPIAIVAYDALRRRLRNVRRWLAKAAADPQGSTEQVHQLRVSIRRALSGIVLFKDLLPRRRRKRLKRNLRTIRLAAGPARDLDVALERLARVDLPAEMASLRPVALDYLSRLRHEVQEPLDAIGADRDQRALRRQCRYVLNRVRWRRPNLTDSEPTYGVDGQRRLRPVVEDFLNAARKEDESLSQLHALRIAGKQLRYGVEILAGSLHGDDAARLLGLLNELQDRLGRVNDHAIAQTHYGEWAADGGGKTVPLWAWLTQTNSADLEAAREEFHAWWAGDRGQVLRSTLSALLHDRSAA